MTFVRAAALAAGIIFVSTSPGIASLQVSPDQGGMNWHQGKSHCEGMGMSLPSIAQLRIAMETHGSRIFAGNHTYWTIEHPGVDSANMATTSAAGGWVGYGLQRTSNPFRVVCVRVN